MANKFAEKMKKRNPAMMFISTPEEEPEEEAPEVSVNPDTGRNRLTIQESPAHKRIREEKEAAEEAGRKRREAEASTLKAGAPALNRAPQRGEAKSRRLQLLIQPSLYEAVKARAEAEGLSVNEEIGELLRSALSK